MDTWIGAYIYGWIHGARDPWTNEQEINRYMEEYMDEYDKENRQVLSKLKLRVRVRVRMK